MKVLVETSSTTSMFHLRITKYCGGPTLTNRWNSRVVSKICYPPMDHGLQMKKGTTFKPPIPIKLCPSNSYRLLSDLLHPPFPLWVDVTNTSFLFIFIFFFKCKPKVEVCLFFQFGYESSLLFWNLESMWVPS